MNLEEFESQVRDEIEQVLNQLQSATLVLAQLEAQISQVGQTVQDLSQTVENFVDQQRKSQSGN